MKNSKMNFPLILIYIAVSITVLLVNFACKPKTEKKFLVGIVSPSSGLEDVVAGFKQGMEKQGYYAGQNINYLYDGPLDGIEQVDTKIREMLAGKVDLIYSLTTPATRKLKKAIAGTDVSGVFGPVFDPVASGLVESLSSPGGQITGVKVRGSTAKALEWLLAIVPDVKRIFIPFHSTDKAASQTVEDLQETALKFDIELVTEDVTKAEELEKALTKIPDDTDALWLTCSHLLFSNVHKIVQAAAARKIPVASSTHSRQRSGILVAYGENDTRLGEQVSRLADKLLKGVHPENVPVENAEYFLVINLPAARNIGIEVPDSVLKQADFIVR
jgi:putative ABC transport system substrate-binding protein